jgi:hypothetical protein
MPTGPDDKIRADEQTWSKQGRETAVDQGKETAKTPGQYGRLIVRMLKATAR